MQLVLATVVLNGAELGTHPRGPGCWVRRHLWRRGTWQLVIDVIHAGVYSIATSTAYELLDRRTAG